MIITCFGYGSLVNAATLEPGLPAVPARLYGWRRAWRHSGPSSYGPRCTLTLVEAAGAIDGVVIIAQPAEALPALDRREAQYARIPIGAKELDWLDERPGGWPEPFVYVGAAEFARPGDRQHPIVLSYVDVVVAGFHAVFGEAGVERFFATTDGWDVPVLDDRHSPIYPRALLANYAIMRLVDHLLQRVGTPILTR